LLYALKWRCPHIFLWCNVCYIRSKLPIYESICCESIHKEWRKWSFNLRKIPWYASYLLVLIYFYAYHFYILIFFIQSQCWFFYPITKLVTQSNRLNLTPKIIYHEFYFISWILSPFSKANTFFNSHFFSSLVSVQLSCRTSNALRKETCNWLTWILRWTREDYCWYYFWKEN
jgi:hypothetical protein